MRDACYVLRSLAMVLGEQEWRVSMKVPAHIFAMYRDDVGLRIIEAGSIVTAVRAFKRVSGDAPPDWMQRIPECAYGEASRLAHEGWRGDHLAFMWDMKHVF